MRWFRSGVKEEERVAITPLGDLAAFESVRREDAPGPRPSREEARAVSLRFLASRGLPRRTSSRSRPRPSPGPKRTDWTFVDERQGFRMGEATVRYATTVSGDEVTAFREFVHVPGGLDAGLRAAALEERDGRTSSATSRLFVTFLAMLGVLDHEDRAQGRSLEARRRPSAAVAFVLALLSTLNGIPLTLYDYDTASPLSGVPDQGDRAGGPRRGRHGAGIALVVASAEPIYRERFPRHLSLSGLFSRRGLRTKGFFRGLLLGYALAAFFFAYQAVFYVVAARFGAWAPADIPYSDMLNTAFPWATVLLIGFLPAVSEEGSAGCSRSPSSTGSAPAGSSRSCCPPSSGASATRRIRTSPSTSAGSRWGSPACVIGFLMLRFGALPLLVWHFTVDAIYTALLLLRSGNAYYVAAGGVVGADPPAAARGLALSSTGARAASRRRRA